MLFTANDDGVEQQRPTAGIRYVKAPEHDARLVDSGSHAVEYLDVKCAAIEQVAAD